LKTNSSIRNYKFEITNDKIKFNKKFIKHNYRISYFLSNYTIKTFSTFIDIFLDNKIKF